MRRSRAFSLIELVIVTVIVGIVAAIAAPRFSRTTQAATAQYVAGSVAAVRRVMNHYYAEHGRYPGHSPGSDTPSDAMFARQLLEYSDEAGKTQQTYGYPYIYGPYLRPPFPVNPFNVLDTVKVKATSGEAHALGATGWIAVLSDGDFGINAAAADTKDLEAVLADGEMIRAKGDKGL